MHKHPSKKREKTSNPAAYRKTHGSFSLIPVETVRMKRNPKVHIRFKFKHAYDDAIRRGWKTYAKEFNKHMSFSYPNAAYRSTKLVSKIVIDRFVFSLL